jgi:hypothetical protein
MINTGTIRNCTKPFPAVEGLVNPHSLGKIIIKNIYQGWQGENMQQVKQKHEENPYSLRIGKPSTDEQLKTDPIYFILHYLSYNPHTKDVEMRQIVPYRNTERIYIGQSLDETSYPDSKLLVNGTAVLDDVYLKNMEEYKNVPIGRLIEQLVQRVEKLQGEVLNLRRQLNNSHIYNQVPKNE